MTSGKLKLLGIALVCAAPLVGSYLLYWFWEPSKQMNYGELLPPQPLPAAVLKLDDGGAFDPVRLRGKWLMVIADSGECGEYCRRKLYLMRQIRKAQGKELNRIERVWLIEDASPIADVVRQEHEGTLFVRAAGSALLAGLPAGTGRRDHVYLVDPLGNVMLRYPRDPDPKPMLKDIGRLLKYQRTG